MRDYTAVTERPDSLLTDEQWARMRHRYALALLWGRGPCVLEVACGAGQGLGVWQAAAGTTAVGLDFTAHVLAQAHAAHAGRVALVQGDAARLPLAAACCDTLLCFEALYYLADAAAFAAEARRVLRPGGRLLVAQANPDWPDFAPGPLTTRYHGAHELAAQLAAAGFAQVRLYGAFPVTQAGRVRRLRDRARRLVLAAGLLPTHGFLADRLKRLAYGALTPLPAALAPPSATEQAAAAAALTPLPLDHRDARHRVLYACADA